MKNIMLTGAILDLFDGGAGAAAAGGAPAGGSQGAQGQAGSQAGSASSQQSKTGGKETVIYGKPPEGADTKGSDAGSNNHDVKTTSNTLEEKRARFREMVQGEFKDVYDSEVQGIINRRFRDVKTTQERLESHQPLLDMLAQRYNIADGDVAKIQQAVENDTAYWAEAAEQAGMDVDTYKEVQRFKRENEAMKAAMNRTIQQQKAEQQYAGWMREAEAMKAQYPDFDLRQEIQNPRFLGMLRAGVPIETAYEVSHLNEIKSQAAQAREKAVTDNIRAMGQRPSENGASSNSGVTYKSDVRKLTADDRKKIAAQVRAGKKISF